MSDQKERILVIKLSALGDLVLCFQTFAAIRAAHPQAEIALLTMKPFVDFASQMPWFDKVLVDPRPSFGDWDTWKSLIATVTDFAPTRVYDFQGKFRQSILYFGLRANGKCEWSGAAPFCSHPRFWPPTPAMHYTDFVAAQIERAGISKDVTPDVSWLDAPVEQFNLKEPFALFIPGCAPQHPHKRWPPASYANLSKRLKLFGIQSVAIGTKADVDAVAEIRSYAPDVVDLTGQTSLKEVAGLARRARYVIGNDTGPTHLAAAVGAYTVALMSEQVKASWSAPKGLRTRVLEGKPLAKLTADQVLATLSAYGK